MKYDELLAYRDASIYLSKLIKIIVNCPRLVQFSIGNMAICDAMRTVQLLKLSYEADSEKKVCYMAEVKEKMTCLEVTVNQLFDCGFISENNKAQLYKIIGVLQDWLQPKNEADTI